jgi:hypothetical protein
MPALGVAPRTTLDTGEIYSIYRHAQKGTSSKTSVVDSVFFTPGSDPGYGISFFRVLDLGSRISDPGPRSQIPDPGSNPCFLTA